MFILCHSNVSLENGKKEQLESSEITKVDSAVQKRLKFISVVPHPGSTADAVSLLFSCSSSSARQTELFDQIMLCSTGTSIGICMIFFLHWPHSMLLVSKQFLQVCQIKKESEGVRGKLAKNLLI